MVRILGPLPIFQRKRIMYENPCNHCGFCCLIQLCKIAQELYGAPRNRRCPSLRFNGKESRCGALEDAAEDKKAWVARVIGAGEGCSISAKVRGKDGNFYDFSALPDQTKLDLTEIHLKGEITVKHKRKI